MDDEALEKESSKIIIAVVAYVISNSSNGIDLSKEKIKEYILQYKNDNSLDENDENKYDMFAEKLVSVLDELVENR